MLTDRLIGTHEQSRLCVVSFWSDNAQLCVFSTVCSTWKLWETEVESGATYSKTSSNSEPLYRRPSPFQPYVQCKDIITGQPQPL